MNKRKRKKKVTTQKRYDEELYRVIRSKGYNFTEVSPRLYLSDEFLDEIRKQVMEMPKDFIYATEVKGQWISYQPEKNS